MLDTIELKEKFFNTRLGEETITGMTFRNAGNFYPQSNDAAFRLKDEILKMIGYNIPYIQDRTLIMINKSDTKTETIFIKQPQLKTQLIFREAIIHRGMGAIMFFPGGCPGVVFRDDKANISGLLHGGWRIVADGIIENFLKSWQSAGGKEIWTKIKILPCICQNCLKFDQQYFLSTLLPTLKPLIPNGAHMNQFTKLIGSKVGLDLKSLVRCLITSYGYYLNADDILHDCTCHNSKFWCYRCDDKNGKKYRNAVFVITAPFYKHSFT